METQVLIVPRTDIKPKIDKQINDRTARC